MVVVHDVVGVNDLPLLFYRDYIKILDGPMIFNIKPPKREQEKANHRNLILCDLFEMVEK